MSGSDRLSDVLEGLWLAEDFSFARGSAAA